MSAVDALYLRDTVRLTPGRIKLVARGIDARLTAEERPVIAPFAERAEQAARHAYWLFAGRERAQRGLYSPRAREKNNEMDSASSGVSNLLAIHSRVHAPGTELGDCARRLSLAFFPLSLHHVTNNDYATELAAVRRIIALSKGAQAEDVAAVPGLGSILEVLEQRADEFEAVLAREPSSGPSHQEAQTAGQEAERRMAELVMAVLTYHHGDSADATARRSELLEPYAIQQASLRVRYQRRLPAVDVDPETGEEQGELEGAEREPVSA